MEITKKSVWRVCRLVLCAGLVLFSNARAQDTDDEAISEILKHVEVNKTLLEKEISQIEVRIDQETRQVIEALDHLFDTKISRLVAGHHKEVAKEVNRIELSETAWGVALSQLKAVVGSDEDIKRICNDFLQTARRKVEPLLEELTEKMQEEINPVLESSIKSAQENIRRPFQESMVRYFDVYEGMNLPAAPLPVELVPKDTQAGQSSIPVFGISGILILIFSRILRKAVQKITVKVLGRVLSKLIPVIGALLILVDIYDVSQAKIKLEAEIRAQFLQAYEEEMTADVFWRDADAEDGSYRRNMSESVHELLDKWADQCKDEVKRAMEASHVAALSPNARAYMLAEKEKGRNSQQIAEDMTIVGRTFESSLIASHPLEELLDIVFRAPDRRALQRLVYTLGNKVFMEEYAKGGSNFLEAAHIIGAEEVSRMVKGESTLNWQDAREAFLTLAPDVDPAVRRGLMLLLESGIPYRGVTTSSLEAAGRHEDLFLFLLDAFSHDPPRLLKLISDKDVRDVMRQCRSESEELTLACAREWTELTWKRYAEAERIQALNAAAAYRLKETNQSYDSFARSMQKQDELTLLYLETGVDGLRIWDTFVTAESGEVDRALAREALSFYKKGYPAESLMTRDGIDMARATSWLPIMKQDTFNMLIKLGSFGWIVFWVIGLIVAIFLFWIILTILLKIRRSFRDSERREIMEKKRPVRIIREVETEDNSDRRKLEDERE